VPALIHCSYHKCLTVFYSRVMRASLNRRGGGGYRHFNSDITAFESERSALRLASVNNTTLDLDSLGDYRITRFIRDPRDLLVSGYFYHRRAAEPWCATRDPTDLDWKVVNGTVPGGLAPGESFADYLQRVDRETGLLAEIEFRSRHFDSMREWPDDDPRIRIWRYEDILGNERQVMHEVASHYRVAWPFRAQMTRKASQFDAKHTLAQKHVHIRNPTPGQWREVLTPKVEAVVRERWGDVLVRYGYDAE
jgi:hypothetical protein